MSESEVRGLLADLLNQSYPYRQIEGDRAGREHCIYCWQVWTNRTSTLGDLDHHNEDCAWYRAKRFLQPRPR